MPFKPFGKDDDKDDDKKDTPKGKAKDMSPEDRKKKLKEIHKGLKDRKAKK